MAQNHNIWLSVALAALHFLTTWFLTLLSWTHEWANKAASVRWFPGDLILAHLDGSKRATMGALSVTSVLWGWPCSGLVLVTCWCLLVGKPHSARRT